MIFCKNGAVLVDGRFKSELFFVKVIFWKKKKKKVVSYTKQTMSLPWLIGGGVGWWGVGVGADDNLLSLLTFWGKPNALLWVFSLLHVFTKVLQMLKLPRSFFHKHRHRLSLHFRYHDVCVGRVELSLATHGKEPQLSLGKWFLMSQQKVTAGLSWGTYWNDIFSWRDGYISQPVHFGGGKLFKLLICTLP